MILLAFRTTTARDGGGTSNSTFSCRGTAMLTLATTSHHPGWLAERRARKLWDLKISTGWGRAASDRKGPRALGARQRTFSIDGARVGRPCCYTRVLLPRRARHGRLGRVGTRSGWTKKKGGSRNGS